MTGPMTIALAAGGTGGHMVPAHALDLELRRRGHRTMLLTDARGAGVPALFGDAVVHRLDTARPGGGPIARLRALLGIWRNIGKAKAILARERPDAVVGFGGYPTLPTVLAAHRLGIPACLHEQNAVLGRANRLLARRARAIALSFAETRRAPARAVLTGNPVRAEVAAIAAEPWPRLDGEHMLRLLVIGGSLGARVLSDIVPDALAVLPQHLKARLQVTQQCRAEDMARVRERYRAAGIAADLASYFEDLPERLRWAHLAIARAGASTIAELTAAGRPAILVPLPIATDDHQTANARRMDDTGAGWLLPEPDFTAKELAKRIQRLALEPSRLAAAAEAARKLGRPQAAAALADLVEKVARECPASREAGDGSLPPGTSRREASFSGRRPGNPSPFAGKQQGKPRGTGLRHAPREIVRIYRFLRNPGCRLWPGGLYIAVTRPATPRAELRFRTAHPGGLLVFGAMSIGLYHGWGHP